MPQYSASTSFTYIQLFFISSTFSPSILLLKIPSLAPADQVPSKPEQPPARRHASRPPIAAPEAATPAGQASSSSAAARLSSACGGWSATPSWGLADRCSEIRPITRGNSGRRWSLPARVRDSEKGLLSCDLAASTAGCGRPSHAVQLRRGQWRLSGEPLSSPVLWSTG